jgi:acyl dehydratase
MTAHPLPTPGTRASLTRTITEADVIAFAELSGDHNPIHLDAEYAAQTRFGRRIAHGLLSVGLIGALLGNQLPGPGAIYLSQAIRFWAPVYLGDTVTATVEVIAVSEERRRVTLSTTCANQRGEQIITGEAVVLYEE